MIEFKLDGKILKAVMQASQKTKPEFTYDHKSHRVSIATFKPAMGLLITKDVGSAALYDNSIPKYFRFFIDENKIKSNDQYTIKILFNDEDGYYEATVESNNDVFVTEVDVSDESETLEYYKNLKLTKNTVNLTYQSFEDAMNTIKQVFGNNTYTFKLHNTTDSHLNTMLEAYKSGLKIRIYFQPTTPMVWGV